MGSPSGATLVMRDPWAWPPLHDGSGERSRFDMYEELLSLLDALDGVEQNPRFHPEGDALFHSLQVYQHAADDDAEPELLAAALLHDVGKAISGPDHDVVGADMLIGLPDRTRWCVAHHLDLLRERRLTQRRLANTPQLRDLQRLRRWDLGGRDPFARVCSPEQAVSHVLEALESLGGFATEYA